MAFSSGTSIVQDGLTLYFDTHNQKCYAPLDTTLHDLSGNGNNGVFVNPAFGDDTIESDMPYYDGTGTGTGTADGSRVDFSAAACTSNPTSYPDGRTLIWVAKPDDVIRRGLLIGSSIRNHLEQASTTSFRTEAKLQNGYSFGATGCVITANKYDMFAIVFDNDLVAPTAKWYENGVSFYEKSMINGTSTTDYFEPVSLGRETGTTSYFYAPSYKGFIPIFISYSRALSQAEVLQNFNALRGRFGL